MMSCVQQLSRLLTKSVGSSIEGLGLCTQSSGYHAAVDGLDVWDLAHNHRPVLVLRGERVDGVAQEENRRQVGKLGALGNFFPVLDLVVGDVEVSELLKGRHVVKSFNLVVAEPELLQCGGDIFQILNPLDVVAGERKNFQVLKALHGHDLLDGVSRKRKFLAVLELVNLVIQSLNLVGQLAAEIDLGGLLWRDSCLLLPLANGFSQ